MIVRMRLSRWYDLQFGVHQLSSPDGSIGFLEVFNNPAEFFKAYPEETKYFEIEFEEKNNEPIPEQKRSSRSGKKRDGMEGEVLPGTKRPAGGKSRATKVKSKLSAGKRPE
jgi:hypothetical protein